MSGPEVAEASSDKVWPVLLCDEQAAGQMLS
jgi:hypothetical protein